MGPMALTVDRQVAILTLSDGENRFNPSFLDAFLDSLDRIEQQTDARALVVTSAHEKIFSNGIDLEWIVPVIQKGDTDTAKAFFYSLNRLFKRILTLPLITVAAISGHAFAGGAILCCAFDFRFMRAERGFFCFPEVDLGIPFLPGMNALLRKAIPMDKVVEMELTGIRFTAQQCEALRIIHKACPGESLLEEAVGFARALEKNRKVVYEMKRRLYQDILHAIEVEDVPHIESGRFNIG